jgi:hypothetical protein
MTIRCSILDKPNQAERGESRRFRIRRSRVIAQQDFNSPERTGCDNTMFLMSTEGSAISTTRTYEPTFAREVTTVALASCG